MFTWKSNLTVGLAVVIGGLATLLLLTDARGQTRERPGAAPEQKASRIDMDSQDRIDDFEDGDRINIMGGSWFDFDDSQVRDDRGNLGKSTVQLVTSTNGFRGSAYAIEMRGILSPVNRWSFVGFGTYLKEDGMAFDLSPYRKLSFDAWGDGRRYKVNFYSEAIRDHAFHEQYFKTTKNSWVHVDVELARVRQPEWARPRVGWTTARSKVSKIQWQTDSDVHEGEVSLVLDNIVFTR